MIVLDTSAVLALLLDEAGKERVAARMAEHDALLSCVNATEVIGIIRRKAMLSFDDALGALEDLDLYWWEPTQAEAIRAAEWSNVKDLALGDRFCIALAEVRGDPILTADRAWAELPIRVPVELIR